MNDEATPPAGDNNAKPTVKVNQDTCIGCGVCTSVAPEVFEMRDDGKSHVKDSDLSAEALAKAEEAKGACPVGAITIE